MADRPANPADQAKGASRKQCRRVTTRYNKLAANYLAFVKLACIRLWLGVHANTV
jgi:transposase